MAEDAPTDGVRRIMDEMKRRLDEKQDPVAVRNWLISEGFSDKTAGDMVSVQLGYYPDAVPSRPRRETPDEVEAALEADPNAEEDTELYERGGEVIFVDRLDRTDEEA